MKSDFSWKIPKSVKPSLHLKAWPRKLEQSFWKSWAFDLAEAAFEINIFVLTTWNHWKVSIITFQGKHLSREFDKTEKVAELMCKFKHATVCLPIAFHKSLNIFLSFCFIFYKKTFFSIKSLLNKSTVYLLETSHQRFFFVLLLSLLVYEFTTKKDKEHCSSKDGTASSNSSATTRDLHQRGSSALQQFYIENHN